MGRVIIDGGTGWWITAKVIGLDGSRSAVRIEG